MHVTVEAPARDLHVGAQDVMKAYQVLSDCRRAHELLEHEADAQSFRVLFVAAVTLCRAVGHVLHKVDARERPELAERIATWWRDVKSNPNENRIFHGFIEQQRNLVLKEYEFRHDDSNQTLIVLPSAESFTLDELVFCPITEGEYTGEDCRDILAEAISWWEAQLCQIENGKPQQGSCS